MIMNQSKYVPPSLNDIKINDSFWAPRIELFAKEVIPYQWDALNDKIPNAEPSHAIENFRITAGESAGEFHGMVFQDSDVAKWIEAASYSLVSYADAELENTIDWLIDLLGKAQQPDGYLNTYYTVAKPEERWKNFAWGHELYCAGHLIEAAVAYFLVTGKRKFLMIVCRYADHIDSLIGPGVDQKRVYCGHEEIELALVKLYRVTGEKRYLRLSQYFIDERGRQPSFLIDEPNFGDKERSKWMQLDYHQAHAPVREQTKADGHAVRAMYLYSAMADLALETGDESLYQTLQQLWTNVTHYRMYITGALGSQAYGERFTIDYDLPNDTAYAETCASIGLIFWAQRMFSINPDSQYADVLERALYNGVLSGISLDGRKYFYVNPLEVVPEVIQNRQDHQHVKPERQQWFGCACCPPNIARLITSLGQYIYSQNKEELYVHLFIGSEARLSIGNQKVLMIQKTKYPWDGGIAFLVTPEEQAVFTIALRIPGWCRNYRLELNGESLKDLTIEQGYVKIKRLWHKEDKITLFLEMPVELVQAHPKVRENYGKIAIQRGPVVYCLEQIDNGEDLWSIALGIDSRLKVKFAADLLGGVAVIEGEAIRIDDGRWGNFLYGTPMELANPVKIKAVPYFLWGNRGPGEMIVWVTRNDRK